jgi:hypothetical protein
MLALLRLTRRAYDLLEGSALLAVASVATFAAAAWTLLRRRRDPRVGVDLLVFSAATGLVSCVMTIAGHAFARAAVGRGRRLADEFIDTLAARGTPRSEGEGPCAARR